MMLMEKPRFWLTGLDMAKDIRDIKVPISDMWSEPYFFQKIYEDSLSVYNYYNELWC